MDPLCLLRHPAVRCLLAAAMGFALAVGIGCGAERCASAPGAPFAGARAL